MLAARFSAPALPDRCLGDQLVPSRHGWIWLDQFFLAIDIEILVSLADMGVLFLLLLRTVCCPDLICIRSTLTFDVLKRASCIHARIEFARRLQVGEFAMFYLAIRPVPAHWHCRVFEWTAWIRAVWVELALFFRLVGFDLSWTRMSADTFGVFAGCSEGARIRHIDCSA
jgi:hypothetical protein